MLLSKDLKSYLLHKGTAKRLEFVDSQLGFLQADFSALFYAVKKGEMMMRRKEVAETEKGAAKVLNKKKRWIEEDTPEKKETKKTRSEDKKRKEGKGSQATKKDQENQGV